MGGGRCFYPTCYTVFGNQRSSDNAKNLNPNETVPTFALPKGEKRLNDWVISLGRSTPPKRTSRICKKTSLGRQKAAHVTVTVTSRATGLII